MKGTQLGWGTLWLKCRESAFEGRARGEGVGVKRTKRSHWDSVVMNA
jgi:hypothetical protein